MIPFISNTFNALNIRLGNNPNSNIRNNPIKQIKNEKNNTETTTCFKEINEIDEYFKTCFDKDNRQIESQRCKMLKESFVNLFVF